MTSTDDTSTAFHGAASAVDAASAHLTTGSCDRDKRQRDEPQIGSAEHVQLFRESLVQVQVCRLARNKFQKKFSRQSAAWCRLPSNRAELAVLISKVDEALDRAAVLRVGIILESLKPRVQSCQWQPSSGPEKQRELASRCFHSASASGHSTPSRSRVHEISAPVAMKQLDSSMRVAGAHSIRTPEQMARYKTTRAQSIQQQKYELGDRVFHPGQSFSPEDSLQQQAEQQRLSEVDQFVCDCSTKWSDTEQFLVLVHAKQLAELDMTNVKMRKYFEIIDGGVSAVCAVWNVGGNPFYYRWPATIERAMLYRILTAIAAMVIHPLCD